MHELIKHIVFFIIYEFLEVMNLPNVVIKADPSNVIRKRWKSDGARSGEYG